MTGDGERHRVAVHESGHCYVAAVLGRRITAVTVTPGKRWGGTAHYSPGRTPGDRAWARLDPSQPLTLWPAAVRRSFETRALVAIAGDAAEHLLCWPTRSEPGRVPDPLAEQAADAAPLTDRQRLKLAAAEADMQGRTDLEQLEFLGQALYPDDFHARVTWWHWIDAEARAIVTAGADRIERLAAVLSDRGRLSGQAVREILTPR